MNTLASNTPEEAAASLISTYGLPYDADKFRMLLELSFQMGVTRGVEQCQKAISASQSRPASEPETLSG